MTKIACTEPVEISPAAVSSFIQKKIQIYETNTTVIATIHTYIRCM